MKHAVQLFRAARYGWNLYRATLTAHYAGTFARMQAHAQTGTKGGTATLRATG